MTSSELPHSGPDGLSHAVGAVPIAAALRLAALTDPDSAFEVESEAADFAAGCLDPDDPEAVRRDSGRFVDAYLDARTEGHVPAMAWAKAAMDAMMLTTPSVPPSESQW